MTTFVDQVTPVTAAWLNSVDTAVNTTLPTKAANGANSDITSLTAVTSMNGGALAGFRNRIMNGDMTVFQRGVRYVNGYGPADRWQSLFSVGTWTLVQDTDAPAGFSYSITVSTSTTNTQLATDYYIFTQKIEGVNIKDFGQGFAGASNYTLSFWVKSSVTGTHSGIIASGDNLRSYGFTYSIPVANTWTKISINILGDVSGGLSAYPRTNLAGLQIKWDLGCGSNYRVGSSGSWLSATNQIGVTGSTGIAQTSGATWKITGVQLELGLISSSFEQRPYSVEWALCQRYFETGGGASFVVSPNNEFPSHGFAVTKRTVPVMVFSPASGTGATPTVDANGFYQGTNHSAYAQCPWTAEAEL